MPTTITVELAQVGPTTSEATIRTHTLTIDRPQAKGGADRGPMGGEVLLAALGGCFASTLYAAAAARGAALHDLTITVSGSLADSPSRYEAIDVVVRGHTADPAGFDRLVQIAERGCIVANTLRSAVALRVEAVARTTV